LNRSDARVLKKLLGLNWREQGKALIHSRLDKCVGDLQLVDEAVWRFLVERVYARQSTGPSPVDFDSDGAQSSAQTAVIHDKRIDWSKGYGMAGPGGPPVSALTLFGAASMSKPVTALAVLRLVQEGKIDPDADVNTYLKSWKIPANEYTKNHPVTARELLSHTSGIGTHNGAIYDPDKRVPAMLEMLDGSPSCAE
jgi:CubicO group peptidase (beta-lactamase class C family)